LAKFATPLGALEASLRAYVADERFESQAFDLSAVDHTPEAPPTPKRGAAAAAKKKAAESMGSAPAPSVDAELEEARALVASMPQFAHFGAVHKTAPAVELTEAETEYAVSCVKHVFARHVVFQFRCANTIEEQVLEDVSVGMELIEGEDGAFEEADTVTLPRMPLNQAGSTFVAFAMPDPAARVAAKFACVLRFTSKEVDPSSGEPEEDGYEDEYTLEDVDVSTLDLIKPSGTANFRKQWDESPEENERSDDYGLGTRESLEEAVDAVTQILGMAPCEGSEAVPPNARSHATLLSGTFVGDVRVLVRLNLGIDTNQNVAMKLTVRSSDPAVSDLIHQIIADA
jgi:coatomer protein complex subunit gamma